jgi:hypothetical protein
MRTPKCIVNAALVAALFLGPAACGWTSDGGARLDGLYHPDAGADATATDPGPTDTPAEAAPDAVAEDGIGPGDEGAFDVNPTDVPESGLAGTWAVRLDQEGELTPLFTAWPITTTDYFLATVEPGATTMVLTLCNEVPVVHDEDTEMDFITEMPANTATKLGETPVDLTLAAAAASLPAQKVIWTWGLTGVGETDALPTAKDDAHVVDQDQDGHVGVTMTVIQPVAGERYLVKRVVWDLSAGTLSTDRLRLTGTLTYVIDESPLDADPSALKAPTPITPKDGSAYVMRRVSDLTCATLLQHRDQIFAP